MLAISTNQIADMLHLKKKKINISSTLNNNQYEQRILYVLLVGDTIMIEKHLKQPPLAQSASRSFTKNKKRIQKIKGTEDSKCVYQNELVNACFQYDVTYGDYKDLVGIKTSDKVLHDKAFEIVTNLQSNRFQRELAFLV